MNRLTVFCGSALTALLTLSSCSNEEQASVNLPVTETKTVPANVWATVNGTPLVDAELDYALSRFFGNQFIDARAEQKVRESLIASRAISLQAESTLSEQQLADLEVAVNAYREERLVAAYIESVAIPEPVTSQMVEAYYADNLAEFGARTLKRLEVLEATVSATGLSQVQASQSLARLGQAEQWSNLALPEGFQRYSVADSERLSPTLRLAISSLELNQQTDVITEAGRILVLKLLAVEQVPAAPISEVSANIRQRLAATQLSKTVKELSEQAISESEVIKLY